MHAAHPQQKPVYTLRQRQKRVRFSKDHLDDDWSTTLATDEVEVSTDGSINAHNNFVWLEEGEDAPVQRRNKFPGVRKYFIGISKHGALEPLEYKGNLNSDSYQRLIDTALGRQRAVWRTRVALPARRRVLSHVRLVAGASRNSSALILHEGRVAGGSRWQPCGVHFQRDPRCHRSRSAAKCHRARRRIQARLPSRDNAGKAGQSFRQCLDATPFPGDHRGQRPQDALLIVVQRGC